MKCTPLLSMDHIVILRALGLLQVVARHVARDDGGASSDAKTLLGFFREFADRSHHAKEESFLFPRLMKAGMPVEGGPLGVMLFEHDQGRALVANMSESLDRGDGPAFQRYAEGYSQLLVEHIEKEDKVLFVMTESALTEQDDADLVSDFNAIEVKSGSRISGKGLDAFIRLFPESSPIIMTPDVFPAFAEDPQAFLAGK